MQSQYYEEQCIRQIQNIIRLIHNQKGSSEDEGKEVFVASIKSADHCVHVNTNANPKIIELREVLARQFQQVAPRKGALLPTLLPLLDAALGGGLCRGGMVEIVSRGTSAGGASLLHAVLRQMASEGRWSALIDGGDEFDPQSAPETLGRLLWLRCHTAAEAVQSADLLLRDGNLPLVCLDLQGNALAEVRRIPGPTWYRLQRVLEPTSVAFLALTPQPTIPCAEVRLSLQGHFSLAALEDEATAYWQQVELQVLRQRQLAPADAPLLAATA